jgi:hypothetical protein
MIPLMILLELRRGASRVRRRLWGWNAGLGRAGWVSEAEDMITAETPRRGEEEAKSRPENTEEAEVMWA